MAPCGQILAQRPQPVQPTEHFAVTPILSVLLLQINSTFLLAGILSIK